jgi:ferredoxin-type protein NapH
MCPYHLVSDGAVWLRRRLRERILSKSGAETLAVPRAFTANVARFGFLILGTALAGAVGIPVLNYVSAPGILSTEAMILVKERTVSVEFTLIAVLVLLELLLIPRFWCRLFCPTGAFLSLFRAPFSLRIETLMKSPRSPCCKENRCSDVCPMGLEPFFEGSNLLCTNCGLCIDACSAGKRPGNLRFKGFSLGAS